VFNVQTCFLGWLSRQLTRQQFCVPHDDTHFSIPGLIEQQRASERLWKRRGVFLSLSCWQEQSLGVHFNQAVWPPAFLIWPYYSQRHLKSSTDVFQTSENSPLFQTHSQRKSLHFLCSHRNHAKKRWTRRGSLWMKISCLLWIWQEI